MFGVNGSVGILGCSVEFILKSKKIKVNIVEMIGNDSFDLGDGKSKLSTNKTLISIDSLDAFNKLLSKVLKLRTQKSTDQNKTSSRSHLIFELSFEDGSPGKMAFADLAGWESPMNKNDMKETIFINTSLTSLNTVLASIAQKKVVSFNSKL